MSLEISEDIVSLCYQCLGCFVIEGMKVGAREIDLLALRLNNDGSVVERLHIEVSISTRPIGVLRPKAGLASGSDPTEAAKGFAYKKFFAPNIRAAVQKAFRSDDYRRVFVYGRLTDAAQTQLDVLRNLKIECKSVRTLLEEALVGPVHNRLQRAVEIAALFHEQNT